MPLTASVCGTTNNNLSVNLTVSAGETVATQLTLSSGGSPVNLTGYTLKMQIGFDEPLLLDTGNGGISIVNAADGIIQINMAYTMTDQFAPGTYYYDLVSLSPGDTTVMRVIAGAFVVLETVTPVP